MHGLLPGVWRWLAGGVRLRLPDERAVMSAWVAATARAEARAAWALANRVSAWARTAWAEARAAEARAQAAEDIEGEPGVQA